MKLNTREKLLIILLSALVILLGGYKLLIESAIQDISGLDSELNNAKSKKFQMQNDILLAKTIDQKNKELEEELKLALEPFFPSIENDKLQIFFQNIANNLSISFDSFVMAEKVATQITNNQIPAFDGPQYPAKDAVNEIIGIKENKAGEASAPANPETDQKADGQQNLIELTVVSFETKCNYDKLNQILNAIRQSGRIMRVSSLSATPGGDSGTLNVSISVECYGIKKIDSSDSLLTSTLPPPSGKPNPFS
ncbi:MAG: hypothetical protein ACOYJS_02125 [Acutalibacteraceae bacterium]|jgi:Tfp pilus assembly protein PilO